jgi:catechol 2,3-dioxygenase-like lactoylglutathione lyase family enzyme
MRQLISLITLGITDIERSRRFYQEGFGWKPVFHNDDITFYQVNGFVFGTWPTHLLADDMQRNGLSQTGAFALAHNVETAEEVAPAIERLTRFGAKLLRPAEAPPHGGLRGYIADPDGHAWEIAWNPDWRTDAQGHVTFGI